MGTSSLEFKEKLFTFLHHTKRWSRATYIFQVSIITLIILNVIMVIAETFSLPDTWQAILYYFEVFSVIVFSIEIVARIYTADLLYPKLSPFKARVRYFLNPMSIIDLLSVAYFYIPVVTVDTRVLRTFRLLRIFRIFKLGYYIDECRFLVQALKDQTRQLLVSSFLLLVIILVSSILMYSIENQAQPDVFENVFSAFWWSVATLTTVGYGDIYPVTVLGKLLSAIIALTSISLVAVPTSIIAAGLTRQINEEESGTICRKCQKKIDSAGQSP